MFILQILLRQTWRYEILTLKGEGKKRNFVYFIWYNSWSIYVILYLLLFPSLSHVFIFRLLNNWHVTWITTSTISTNERKMYNYISSKNILLPLPLHLILFIKFIVLITYYYDLYSSHESIYIILLTNLDSICKLIFKSFFNPSIQKPLLC
jgi:hypothetical protein